jgi:hypothetical protein
MGNNNETTDLDEVVTENLQSEQMNEEAANTAENEETNGTKPYSLKAMDDIPGEPLVEGVLPCGTTKSNAADIEISSSDFMPATSNEQEANMKEKDDIPNEVSLAEYKPEEPAVNSLESVTEPSGTVNEDLLPELPAAVNTADQSSTISAVTQSSETANEEIIEPSSLSPSMPGTPTQTNEASGTVNEEITEPSSLPPSKPEEFDDFGDFDSTPTQATEAVTTSGADDDFGDFEETVASKPDDDFGDFGETVTSKPLLPIYPQPSTDEMQESRLEKLLPPVDSLDPTFKYMQIINSAFALGPLPEFEDPPALTSDLWTNIKGQMTSPKHTDVFRWRKSYIRHSFITALSSNPESKETKGISPKTSESVLNTAPVVAAVPMPVFESDDPREIELLMAKKLVDISSNELANKSPEQLQELIAQLQDLNAKLQQQANYYLDAKEQLVIDAEMHNKMIASLVVYAQQQQLTQAALGNSYVIVAAKGRKKK